LSDSDEVLQSANVRDEMQRSKL